MEKTAVRLSIIAFISVNFLNRLLCMATGGNAVGEINAVKVPVMLLSLKFTGSANERGTEPRAA